MWASPQHSCSTSVRGQLLFLHSVCVLGVELRWSGVAVYVYPLNYLMLRTLDMRSVLQHTTHLNSALLHNWDWIGTQQQVLCPLVSRHLHLLPLLWVFYTPHVSWNWFFHLAQPSWFVLVYIAGIPSHWKRNSILCVCSTFSISARLSVDI